MRAMAVDDAPPDAWSYDPVPTPEELVIGRELTEWVSAALHNLGAGTDGTRLVQVIESTFLEEQTLVETGQAMLTVARRQQGPISRERIRVMRETALHKMRRFLRANAPSLFEGE